MEDCTIEDLFPVEVIDFVCVCVYVQLRMVKENKHIIGSIRGGYKNEKKSLQIEQVDKNVKCSKHVKRISFIIIINMRNIRKQIMQ